MDRRKKRILVIVLLAVAALIAGVVIYYPVYKNRRTINLNKYIKTTFTGGDGYGVLKIDADREGLQRDYGDVLSVPYFGEKPEKHYKGISDSVELVVEKYILDDTNCYPATDWYLSNGQKIYIYSFVNDEKDDQLGCWVNLETFTVRVEGLKADGSEQEMYEEYNRIHGTDLEPYIPDEQDIEIPNSDGGDSDEGGNSSRDVNGAGGGHFSGEYSGGNTGGQSDYSGSTSKNGEYSEDDDFYDDKEYWGDDYDEEDYEDDNFEDDDYDDEYDEY